MKTGKTGKNRTVDERTEGGRETIPGGEVVGQGTSVWPFVYVLSPYCVLCLSFMPCPREGEREREGR